MLSLSLQVRMPASKEVVSHKNEKKLIVGVSFRLSNAKLIE